MPTYDPNRAATLLGAIQEGLKDKRIGVLMKTPADPSNLPHAADPGVPIDPTLSPPDPLDSPQ